MRDCEGDMGCYPLKKMASKVFGRCNGGRRQRHSTRMVYSPPPTYSHTRTVAKSVTFSNDNPIIVIPPEPHSGSANPKYYPQPDSGIPRHYPEPVSSASASGSEPKEPARTQSAPRPGPKPEPQNDIRPGPVHREPATAYHGPVHGYVPSPLPRWEEGPRRREYFGGEYSYYPTPIREGIYNIANIATDPSRITSMFSEENPNACTIA